MSFKTIAGRSDGVFWWFPALSEDQEKNCWLHQNYLVALMQPWNYIKSSILLICLYFCPSSLPPLVLIIWLWFFFLEGGGGLSLFLFLCQVFICIVYICLLYLLDSWPNWILRWLNTKNTNNFLHYFLCFQIIPYGMFFGFCLLTARSFKWVDDNHSGDLFSLPVSILVQVVAAAVFIVSVQTLLISLYSSYTVRHDTEFKDIVKHCGGSILKIV